MSAVTHGARGHGGAPAFMTTPSTLSGLKAWWRASDIAQADNTAVASWSDLSGNGHTATQGTGSAQPTLQTNELNGQAVVRFDSGDGMSVATMDLTATNAVTVFAACTAAATTDRIICELSPTFITAANLGFALIRDAAGTVSVARRDSVGISLHTNTRTLSTTPRAIIGTIDGGLATNECETWVDGATAGTRSSNSNTTQNFGSQPFFIGSRNNASLRITGDIAELGVFSRALTTTERSQLGAYLAVRYGLTLG